VRMKEIEAFFPLSPMQQGMLFHTLYAPEREYYIEQVSFALHVELDVNAFERAWQQVVNRHQALRASFLWEELREPVQVIHRQVTIELEKRDWRSVPASDQESLLESLLQSDRRQGFQLSQAPLMRLTLVRMTENHCQIIWSHHHLLLDGWSVPILLNEVVAYYSAFSEGRELHLKPPRPYRDYITWVRRQDLARAEAFWREKLKGFTTPTTLELGRPSESVADQSKDYSEQHTILSEAETMALEDFARRHQLTLSALLNAGWALLLSHYSGEDDVVFGLTVSGRPVDLAGVELMAGLFINTLPLRVQITGDGKTLGWLKKHQLQQAELLQYEYSPLVEVHGWSEVPRGVPLFESILVFGNYPGTQSSEPSVVKFEIGQFRMFQRSNYPLTLLIAGQHALILRLIYDQRRFAGPAITRMLEHFKSLLREIVVYSTQPVGSLSLLSTIERHQMFLEWNDTKAEKEVTEGLHELFAYQAEENSESVAVVFEEEGLTFGELNRRANWVARRLQAMGVAPEVLVGICVERSVEMVVGILAILKAGGAYVPIDPSYPHERVAFMMEDAGVGALLTQRRLASELPPHPARVVCVDEEMDRRGRSDEPVRSDVSPGNLAYLIYTSGSTGRPKGVGVSHRGVIRLVMQDGYATLDESQRILQAAPLSFDASTFEIWGALLRGGQSVLYPGRTPTAGELGRVIRRQGVTTMWLTASLFNAVIDDDASQLEGLEQLLIGGEALSVRHVRMALEQLPGTRIINGYGPTESTTFASTYEILGEVGVREEGIPIGRPIANTELYVVDGQAQIAPIGVTGEICIGGEGLARGYLNGAERTAEKFVPNPHGEKAGERIYRTGDLGRYGGDGAVEYLGRLDHQVKVRGYRVELGEVEASLGQHPAVREVVVSAQKDESGATQLVAYLVTDPSQALTNKEWRRYLEEKMPEYMAPSVWVMLEALPRTANGKVDRRALPSPKQISPGLLEDFVAARRPEEEILANIFSQVLRIETVGIHDNFFDLGGHSLLATQVVSRGRKIFQVEIPVRKLFESPTVAELAESVVELRQRQGASLAFPPIKRIPREGPLPLSIGQQGLLFVDQLTQSEPIHIITEAVRVTGRLNVSALEQSVNEIVRRHEVLRTRIEVAYGQAMQVIANKLSLKMPIVDLSRLSQADRQEQCQRLGEQEAGRKMELAKGPLLRLSLLQLGLDEHVVLLTMHHIVTDGWSSNVFVGELGQLYEVYSNGLTSSLGELNIQYADYAVWQRQWLQEDVLEKQLGYWKQQLANAPQALDLSTDNQRPRRGTFRCASHSFTLSGSLLEGLKKLNRNEGVTLFMTLLAAYQTLLHLYAGQDSVCVGSPVANRNLAETEGLIGFFVNTLVLRTNFSGDPTFREILRRVRDVTLEAYNYQALPFQKLVEALQMERKAAYTPIVQAVFTFHNQPARTLALPRLKLKPIKIEERTTEHDLTLIMQEQTDGLGGVIVYKSDLIEAAFVDRLLDHFRLILDLAVAQPDVRILDLPLIEGRRNETSAATKVSIDGDTTDFDFSS